MKKFKRKEFKNNVIGLSLGFKITMSIILIVLFLVVTYIAITYVATLSLIAAIILILCSNVITGLGYIVLFSSNFTK